MSLEFDFGYDSPNSDAESDAWEDAERLHEYWALVSIWALLETGEDEYSTPGDYRKEWNELHDNLSRCCCT